MIDRKYPQNDLRLKDILEKIYNAIDDLQKQVAERPGSLSPQDLLTVSKQVQAGLIGPFGTPVIGGGSDSKLANLGGGTVTSFSAGDLLPLFTTTEATTTTTPALAFVPIAKAKNLFYAGPATGADANPDFRLLVDADMPAVEVKTDDAFTKTIAGAPYANDAYVTLKDHAGNSVKVMTTLG